MTSIQPRPSVRPVHLGLADGRAVTIRELRPDDADALVAAIAAADPVDLRRRFMGGPPPVSMLVERLEAADGVHNLGLGAFADDGRLVGVAQFDRVDDEPTAEVAIEVQTGWQNQGLGTALLARLARVALDRGVHRFSGTFLADNLPLRRLLRDVGSLVTTTYEAGEGHVELDLDP
jgi:RimJ/RimL family protein N-acetyltransferase